MANQIVTVNVSQTVAPTPSILQRTGAIISQGGTTTAANTLTLLTQLSDLTPILATAKAITTMTWAGSVVTVTTTAAHGWNIGDIIPVVISGVTPAGYNSATINPTTGYVLATITSTTQFTYPLVANPGSVTVQGTALLGDEVELLSQATTFFAQGRGTSVYVLELGEGTVSAGVTALQSFITANPNLIYSYLIPREWDAQSSFITFLGNFNTTTSKTYFHVTTTGSTYTNYTALMKCVLTTIQAPLAPITEFTAAAQFFVALSANPSSSTKVPPLAFSYVYGVTPYPTLGNSALLNTYKAANVGVIGTGAEGGISTAILYWGHTMDGNPWNYWYSVDWIQINLDLNLANAIINGSNNVINPLYYNQAGINALQAVATSTFSTAVAYGLANGSILDVQLPVATFNQNYASGLYAGQLVINAEPFLVYSTENPNDYALGRYAGFAAVYTYQRGFESIVFNVNVSSFVS